MDQETYNGIIRILERGAGVMAREYCQAFTGVVAELQRRIQEEQKAQEAAKDHDEDTDKPTPKKG